ncbi:MAG: Mur ligase family protein [Proteobacteria bacterium]|jgi:dihydrofolate synthase / folylpolyglutamate synthase|nr:Mur ligase family protein [Pseudomonadota bacterium]
MQGGAITFDGISWPPLVGIQDGDYKLQRTKDALAALGNPHLQLKNVVHIAGTNGKGSLTAFTSSVLKANGYSCNVYTSPHLMKINERIKLHGEDIADTTLTSYAKEVYHKLKQHNLHNTLTFFEGMTVLMFYIFEKEKADFNIVEVGLGGRFDATNVIENPLVSVITSISMDHQSYLGNTLSAIAGEKCEIIKPNSNAIIGVQQSDNIYDVFQTKCKAVNANGFVCRSVLHFGNKLDDTYQAQNATLALKTLELISQKLVVELKENVIEAIANTQWAGRMHNVFVHEISKNVMVDCAHNIDGISQFLEYIAKQRGTKVLIFGMLRRKVSDGIVELVQAALIDGNLDGIITVNFHGEECVEAVKLAEIIHHKQCTSAANMQEALTPAQEFDEIFLCGSIYMVGEFLAYTSR